jgi:hypothetical protein
MGEDVCTISDSQDLICNHDSLIEKNLDVDVIFCPKKNCIFSSVHSSIVRVTPTGCSGRLNRTVAETDVRGFVGLAHSGQLHE